MSIVELGHVGLFVEDLAVSVGFYAGVLKLSVTDIDETVGIAFLSSRPDVEHHELVLVARGQAAPPVLTVNQVSWRVDALEDLLACRERLLGGRTVIDAEVTHGNAIGIYFFDPDGYRGEVYWRTSAVVPQPFLEPIDLRQPPERILAESDRLLQKRMAP